MSDLRDELRRVIDARNAEIAAERAAAGEPVLSDCADVSDHIFRDPAAWTVHTAGEAQSLPAGWATEAAR